MKPLALQILVQSRSIAVPSRHVLLLCSAADARAIAEPASEAATSLSCFEQARGLVPDSLSCATKPQEAGADIMTVRPLHDRLLVRRLEEGEQIKLDGEERLIMRA